MMKDDKYLIERLNRYREIPITKKQAPAVEEPELAVVDNPVDAGCHCESPDCECPEERPDDYTVDDYEKCLVDNWRDLAKQSLKKLSESEQREIKDMLSKSKEIKEAINGRMRQIRGKENWSRYNALNDIMDSELVKKWKDYKKRVQEWLNTHEKFPRAIAKAMFLDEYDVDETENLPWNEREYRSIVDKMFKTYQMKNSDYGDSFSKLYEKYGFLSVLMRLQDKLNRLESLTVNQKGIRVSNESVEDTLMDMANYAIMTLIQLHTPKEK